MGLFGRNAAQPYTLEDHSRGYALSQYAPEGIAECYAEYVVAQEAAGAYEGLTFGMSHATEWVAWSARNLAECPECGSPWAIFTPCVNAWECQYCPHNWDAGAA